MPEYTLFHVIKDPVHGTMQFTHEENLWIKPFIDSDTLQRLRHIKQLGMGDYVFPGAVHTRFNHSLGCCFIASQIAQKLGIPKEERQLVMLACLLHDIGHGPFSHAFEDLFHLKLIPHEAWTPYFLAEYRQQDFFDYYNRMNPDFPLNAEKLLLIEEMIMHKCPQKNVLADIVSSQLDADRLDYLLRDSHFCGVSYGEFDFRWMIHSMTIIHTAEGDRLGVTHKGVGVVEHYLMARRLMMRNIYFNQKKLALEYLMVKLLNHLALKLEDDIIFSDIKKTQLGRFLCHVNQLNQSALTHGETTLLKTNFLKQNFNDYKELADYDVFSIIKTLTHMSIEDPAVHIAKRIHTRTMPKIIPIEYKQMTTLESILLQFKKDHAAIIQDWQLAIIKAPHQSYTIEENPILVLNKYGNNTPLSTLSVMIDAIGDTLEHTAFLFVDKAIYNTSSVQQLLKSFAPAAR